MADYIKKKKKQQPKGVIPIPPWDPKKKTPWIKIPTWEKDKRPKPEYIKKKEKKVEYIKKKEKKVEYIKKKEKKVGYIKKKKKEYPIIGSDY